MDMRVWNILLVGVGGQGTVLGSTIVTDVAVAAGYDVKKGELHGLARRGGAVSSHVRYGPKIYSPLIKKGEADIILAFEELEAIRYAGYLAPEGVLLVNCQQIIPPLVHVGAFAYPENAREQLRATGCRLVEVKALDVAREMGTLVLVNTVLLGALSCFLEFSPKVWEEALLRRVPRDTEERNLAAFRSGHALVEEQVAHVQHAYQSEA